jgi:hypothetical protein
VLAATTGAHAHGEPDFIARRRAIDPLEKKLEIEGKLELADDHNGSLVTAQSDDIAAADFALDHKSEPFEKPLYRQIKRRLP